jgi:hypothetical protein
MTKKFLVLAAILLLSAPLAVSAQGSAGTVGASVMARVTSSSAVKGVIARCAILESKIQIKVSNFDNNKVKHLEIYGKVKDRVNALADRLAAQGVDTAVLKAYLVIFDSKIQKFSDDYAIYVTKLKEGQDFVCGKSEGQFRAKWKEAKTALAQVHKDAVDIRTYYAQTLKPELNRIKNQFHAQASTTPETATSTAGDSSAATVQ